MPSSSTQTTAIERTLLDGYRIITTRLYPGSLPQVLTHEQAVEVFRDLLDCTFEYLDASEVVEKWKWDREISEALRQAESANLEDAVGALHYVAWELRQIGRVEEADELCEWADMLMEEMETVVEQEEPMEMEVDG